MSKKLGSTNYSYFPGMESAPIDPLLLRPHASWSGNRGVRAEFGADDQQSVPDGSWRRRRRRPGEPRKDSFGRLYVGAEYARPEPAGPGDLGALIGRSGQSGYRGGRPTFAGDAEFCMGPMKYEGSDAGAFALGVTALVLLAKSMGAF